MQGYYGAFQDKFGPVKLKSIDGEVLLQTMHAHGNRDSLVYWLEFKNDDEFPGQMFGSISGGSAHKFGLFRRKDTGHWVKGSPQNEENISQAEAIESARKHRDQLIAASELLDKLPTNATDEQYLQLQHQLDEAAPAIISLAWTHKYLSLLFPDKLDDYHNHRWQPLGQTDDQRKAVILYPTLTSNASDQAIRLRDLDTGTFHAQVILRPVNLLELELLLRNTDWHSNRQKAALAHELSFGATQEN